MLTESQTERLKARKATRDDYASKEAEAFESLKRTVRSIYGPGGQCTLAEIAEVLDLTRERVAQIVREGRQ